MKVFFSRYYFMENFTIIEARREDAPFIAKTVMGALGEDLCLNLGGGKERLPLVTELFCNLAALEDSQYSYKHSLLAVDSNGLHVGCVIFYDGERLHSLRGAFIKEANKILGWNVTTEDAEEWGDETEPGELYLDSLFVTPEHRGNGVAKSLINEVGKKASKIGKPVGLLCEPENEKALRLYNSVGFKDVGISNFFRVPMKHLQKHF